MWFLHDGPGLSYSLPGAEASPEAGNGVRKIKFLVKVNSTSLFPSCWWIMLLCHALVGSLRCGVTEYKVTLCWGWSKYLQAVPECQVCRVWQQNQRGKGARDPVVSLGRRALFPSLLAVSPALCHPLARELDWEGLPYPICLVPVGFPSAPVLFLFPARAFHSLGLFCPTTGRKAHPINRYWLRETMKPRCVRKTQAHTVLLSPKLAKTPKIVAMKSWGGLWEGDQSYQHLLELGHHKSWDQHHGDSCKTFILSGLCGCPALPPGPCCVQCLWSSCWVSSSWELCPRQVTTHTKTLHWKPPTPLWSWLPLVCKAIGHWKKHNNYFPWPSSGFPFPTNPMTATFFPMALQIQSLL